MTPAIKRVLDDVRMQRHMNRAVYPDMHTCARQGAMALASEAGEVAGEVEKSWRKDAGKFTVERQQRIREELGDVLWWLIFMCDIFGTSLDEIAEVNQLKLEQRRSQTGGI